MPMKNRRIGLLILSGASLIFIANSTKTYEMPLVSLRQLKRLLLTFNKILGL